MVVSLKILRYVKLVFFMLPYLNLLLKYTFSGFSAGSCLKDFPKLVTGNLLSQSVLLGFGIELYYIFNCSLLY